MTPRYLYVIKFGNGVVKVGQSQNPRQRIKHHRYWARLLNTTIDDFDLDIRYGSPLPDERQLVAFCRDRWPALPGHREYFVGADFDQVVGFLRVLTASSRSGDRGR